MKQQNTTELLNTQLNTDQANTPNSNFGNTTQEPTELEFNKEYESTGLWIRGNEKDGYFVTAGQYKVSQSYVSPVDVKKALDNKDLEILMSLISAMIQFHIEHMQGYNNNNQ